MKIFVVGNSLLEEDNLPVKLLPKLRTHFPEIEFIEWDPTENIPQENPLILLDTVQGIEGVHMFEDLDEFKKHKLVSPHDYDLLFELKLQKKLGKLEKIVIIGLSEGVKFSRITSVISEIISQNSC